MIGNTAPKQGRLSLGLPPLADSHADGIRAILRWCFVSAKWIAVILVVFLELNAAAYFLFRSRTMPGVTLYGENVGIKSYAQLQSDVNNKLSTRSLTVTINDSVHSLTYTDLGISFSSTKTFGYTKKLGDFWNLPLIQIFTSNAVTIIPQYDVDQVRLESTLARYINNVDEPAQDAKLVFPDNLNTEIKIKDGAYGSILNPQIAGTQLVQALESGSEIKIQPESVAPKVNASQLAYAKNEAKQLIDNPIVIRNGAKKVSVIEPQVILRMLKNDGSQLAIRQARLEEYIQQELALYFYTAPVTRRINNNVVTAAGKDGIGLDEEAAYNTLSGALLDPNTTEVQLTTAALKPAEVVNGVYPKTDAGLAALIEDFDNEKRGDYNIIVHSMKKGGLGASHGGVEKIIPASTYKAFIAYAALKSVERGEMTMDTMTPHGKLKDCIYEMIHVSTDHCAISIQDHMGWKKVDNLIHEAGFTSTFINNEGFGAEKYTTALDEYRLFRGYYDGTLLNKEHTAYMIDLFKNQMWRSGIPAGSAPAVVADKVGFYALRENDVGIVYAPKGAYVIVAMSHYGTFGEISQLARRIYQFFGN